MSLSIDTDKVTHVLLTDGIWHKVIGKTFDLDSYEYLDRGHCILQGGMVEGVVSTGFTFREDEDTVISGPLTALHAVRTAEPLPAKKRRATNG